MPGHARRILPIILPALLAAACSTTRETAVSPRLGIPSNAGSYKVGIPYQIDGTWYYPREQPDYDETGIASWYGVSFHGRQTANGEVYDLNALTAAHRTLPMPVNVRVTNLDNGRSIILRVNDRGPYARGRIIDVSAHAAELLGFYGAGTAKVRVTFVSRAPLPNGTMPSDTPVAIATALPAAPTGEVRMASLNPVPGVAVMASAPVAAGPVAEASSLDPLPAGQPTGQVTEVAVPAATNIYVQAGAFGMRTNAERLKDRLAAAGNLFVSSIDRKGQRLYRVRIGPFDDVSEADAALARLVGLGNNDARIVVDQ
ncbi:MAG TPA: septal ring lytic transglycosylase RlpA family protein [Rhizomicrobium sp.]